MFYKYINLAIDIHFKRKKTANTTNFPRNKWVDNWTRSKSIVNDYAKT